MKKKYISLFLVILLGMIFNISNIKAYEETNDVIGQTKFVDKDGNKVVDYNYDEVTEVNKYGFAGIKQNGRWGIVDENGKIIVNPKYKLNDIEPIFIGEYYQVIYGNGEIYYTK